MLIEILNVFAAVERELKNVSYCQHFHVETMMESAFKSQHDLLLAMLSFKIYQQKFQRATLKLAKTSKCNQSSAVTEF